MVEVSILKQNEQSREVGSARDFHCKAGGKVSLN
jgi:hypothetical protein